MIDEIHHLVKLTDASYQDLRLHPYEFLELILLIFVTETWIIVAASVDSYVAVVAFADVAVAFVGDDAADAAVEAFAAGAVTFVAFVGTSAAASGALLIETKKTFGVAEACPEHLAVSPEQPYSLDSYSEHRLNQAKQKHLTFFDLFVGDFHSMEAVVFDSAVDLALAVMTSFVSGGDLASVLVPAAVVAAV
jgi:hypothetical protein